MKLKRPRAHVASPIARALREAIGGDNVRDSAIDRNLYARDASVIDDGTAEIVCFPRSTADVVAVVDIARRFGVPIVPRGAGTGLAGGAVPCGRGLVVSTTRMNRVLSVDAESRIAWVEPGVINLDLTKAVASLGLHFAPDPSSQQSCTIGGNLANNSGGPHCLAYGVTNSHILAAEVVLADGRVVVLGGEDPEPRGLDLRGAFVGSEGTMGIATRIAVRLTRNPPAVRTLLAVFETVEDAAGTVSAIIAAGVVPAAIEMMDALTTKAVEGYVHAGFPTDAAAVLLVEVDGLPGGVEAETRVVVDLATHHNARWVRPAADETERALWWKGRKSAFGAIARIKPNYYLHDTVIPRTKLVEVLTKVYEIVDRYGLQVLNVFHAGDGNLHPLLVYDAREPGMLAKVHAAGAEIIDVSLAAGGVLSGEHGIGLEKRKFMAQQFSTIDLEHQLRLRRAFDPDGLLNPAKVLPIGASCADVQHLRQAPEGSWL